MGDGQPRLLDQIWDRIRRKHYSIRTEQAHVPWGPPLRIASQRETPTRHGQ
jgi:hypothetical protein